MFGISSIVDDITPWNDDSTFGQIATGLALGAATGGAGAALGLGGMATLAAGGVASMAYQQDKKAQAIAERISDQAAATRKAAEERRKRLERERMQALASRRRALIAEMALTGNVSYEGGGASSPNITETDTDKYAIYEDTVNY